MNLKKLSETLKREKKSEKAASCWGDLRDNSGVEFNADKKIKTPIEKKMYEYICYCDKVTKGDIVTAVFGGAKTVKEIMEVTGAMKNSNCQEKNPKGVCCGKDIMELIKEYSWDKDN